jgi:hypothetical protein
VAPPIHHVLHGLPALQREMERALLRDHLNEGMRHALNFADDQVLRAYGFRHAEQLRDEEHELACGARGKCDLVD